MGIASRHPVADRGALRGACNALAHRGPDDRGEWWTADGRVGLGHRRLAIIDLSPAGHQPMVDAAGTTVIVFNGEMYNFAELRDELRGLGHVFRSSSDTEVILAAYREWDLDCLDRLNGMFAFALYDIQRGRVLLARDRAGEKPLYYTLAGGTLRFASELKALLVHGGFSPRVNLEALDCYLEMGYVPGIRCILEGVNKLPPAHAFVFCPESGASKLWRYWTVPQYQGGDCPDEHALLTELETLLENAVRRQLVADVPVGILLSGGVDSSLVTAMAARAAPAVRTFTVSFPGYGDYDETKHARLIADHFGTQHLELTAPETTADLLPRLATQFDEPMVDSSMIPAFLVSEVIRQHCTVALGGDGGDELFGGYPRYRRMLRLRQVARVVPTPVRQVVAAAALRLLPIGTRGRNWLGALTGDFDAAVPPVTALFDRAARAQLLGDSRLPLTAEAIRAQRTPVSRDLLQRMTRMDFENYLPEDILVKVDRASMLNSLEIRAPMLDRHLIEFAFARVPSSLKVTPTATKVMLKRLCDRVLPGAFDRDRKQGFSIPLDQWARSGPWRDTMREVLLGYSDSPFDRKFVTELLDRQDRGNRNGERLFALTLFELWRRTYSVSVG